LHIGLGIVCGVGTGDELSEAVGTEIFGNVSDPVQALGFETESTARVCRPSRPENHFMKGLSLAVPSPEGWQTLCRWCEPPVPGV